MGKYNELYGLLGKYQVLKHGNLEKAIECRKENLAEFIYECNAMEGNRLGLDDVKRVIEDGVKNVSVENRDELEVAGLYECMTYVRRLVEENIPLNEEIVKELHKIIYFGTSEDFRGKYRTDYITIPHAQNFPPVRHISYHMNKLFEEYREMENIDVIERIALFHLKFENIHPFADGNGQVGRVIINYQLKKAGYPIISIPAEIKKRYVKAFEIYNNQLDPTPMIEIIAEALKKQLEDRIAALEK